MLIWSPDLLEVGDCWFVKCPANTVINCMGMDS